MKIHTFTVVVGNSACNMNCPYCVSKLTGKNSGLTPGDKKVNWRNFDIACEFANQNNISTILFTGKGEPTLHSYLITDYLTRIDNMYVCFPFKELQTNGILLDPTTPNNVIKDANEWYELDMTTVSLSIAHYQGKINNELLKPSNPDFDVWRVVDILHEIGFSVRINCTLCRDYIDSIEEIDKLMYTCKQFGVEQTTVRMVSQPQTTHDPDVQKWVQEHQFDDLNLQYNVKNSHHELLNLPHGAKVFDYRGQNLCYSNCLTETTNSDDIRQLIFFPDGSLRYDWQYEGARIL